MTARSTICCITSPPYLGLRSYGLPATVWGGREDCNHDWGEEITARQSGGGWAADGAANQKKVWDIGERSQGAFCSKCYAWLGCLGLEPDPDTYCRNLVLIFEDVRRVLSKRGSLWLNIGDSYAGGQCGRKDDAPAYLERRAATYGTGRVKAGRKGADATANKVPPGLKPKDLMGVIDCRLKATACPCRARSFGPPKVRSSADVYSGARRSARPIAAVPCRSSTCAPDDYRLVSGRRITFETGLTIPRSGCRSRRPRPHSRPGEIALRHARRASFSRPACRGRQPSTQRPLPRECRWRETRLRGNYLKVRRKGGTFLQENKEGRSTVS